MRRIHRLFNQQDKQNRLQSKLKREHNIHVYKRTAGFGKTTTHAELGAPSAAQGLFVAGPIVKLAM